MIQEDVVPLASVALIEDFLVESQNLDNEEEEVVDYRGVLKDDSTNIMFDYVFSLQYSDPHDYS